jgi:hypothetical protein
MQQLLTALQARLQQQVPGLQYIDEDWGQLDYYSPHPPVQWPCALIDIATVQWSNQGAQLQAGIATVSITVANVKTTNTSSLAPMAQRNTAFAIHELLTQIHQALHAYLPAGGSSRMYRKSTQRTRRDDGIQQYQLTYQLTVAEVAATTAAVATSTTLQPGVMERIKIAP